MVEDKGLMEKQNLKLFLYLLMRNELPTGKVVALIKEVEACMADEDLADINRQIVYTAEILAEYADQLADRILVAGKVVKDVVVGTPDAGT